MALSRLWEFRVRADSNKLWSSTDVKMMVLVNVFGSLRVRFCEVSRIRTRAARVLNVLLCRWLFCLCSWFLWWFGLLLLSKVS